MVHVQSKYPLDLKEFSEPSGEIASYWFGYLRARAYMFKKRHRIRCRAPVSDIGHLFQLSKDLGTIKAPRKINSGFGEYAQLIIDNMLFCELLTRYGWHGVPSTELDERHVLRGMLDGGGSIARNGKGEQAKYLKIAFYSKDEKILKWIMKHLGKRTISFDQISWVGSKAVDIARRLYLNQSRHLKRKLSLLLAEIFERPSSPA